MPRRRCDMCNDVLPPHGFYIVRMDVFAEPSLPSVSSDELDEMDLPRTIDRLIEQMKHMSPQELQDQVHRRFEFRVCLGCQKKLLANPLGKPREARDGEN
jgi:hypothetical protein